jgi:hypothetical protein
MVNSYIDFSKYMLFLYIERDNLFFKGFNINIKGYFGRPGGVDGLEG